MDIRASHERRRDLRLLVARRQVPEILTWAGLLTLVFGTVNYIVLPAEAMSSWIINLVFGPLLLVLAWAMRRGVIRGEAIPWTWAAASVALIVMLANAFRLEPSVANFAYIIAAMTAFGPLMHVWPPFVAAAAAMLATCTALFAATPMAESTDDVLVCVVALTVSGILLHLRISALDALADSEARLDHLAMFDPMTDTLNRNGLSRELDALSATAQRSEESVLAWFVDVRGLKAANDHRGHEFGDEIILAVTRALRASVRANDLVARWGGDEFVVLGVGREGSAEDLNARVDDLLAADAGLSGDWSRSVTVGFAAGPPGADVFRLIREADADMYRRRIPQ